MLRPPENNGAHRKKPTIDPALAGAAVFVLLLGGIGYNVWREAGVLSRWRSERVQLATAMAQADELAGGNHAQVLGAMDTTCIDDGAYCLPSATCSRLWMDDPRVAPLVDELLPCYSAQAVIDGTAPVAVILLWEEPPGRRGRSSDLELIAELERNWAWRELIADVDGARLFIRGN